MSSADAPGDLPAVGALTVRDAGGEKGKGKARPPPSPEASAADGDETSESSRKDPTRPPPRPSLR